MQPGITGVLPLDSDLIRKGWMQNGIIQSSAKSFWAAMTGSSPDNVVYMCKNGTGAEGHNLVFDYRGNYTGKAIEGDERAFGKGGPKLKFSDTITIKRYTIPINNGDRFYGKQINDLQINEHSDSRRLLSDLFIRWKDQAIFDVLQGVAGESPTHIIDLDDTLDFDAIIDIVEKVRTSTGFSTGGARRPLEPFMINGDQECWGLIVDPYMEAVLKKSQSYKSLVQEADVRGNENRAIKGVIGKIDNLLIMRAPVYFGSSGGGATIDRKDNEVDIAGLRRKDANGKWTGQEGYISTGSQHSRGILVGKNACQLAFGMQPDYLFQKSEDFGRTSESAVEFWMNAQKTILKAETQDYKAAKITGIDFGCIAVDVETQTA